LYGFAGIVIAAALYWICRDKPQDHPRCNTAEQNLIADELTRKTRATASQNLPFPWRSVLTSLSLWGNCCTQLLTNIGWLFVVTWLPRYLGQVHGVPLNEQAIMTAVPTVAGIAGMYCGGWWTDLAAHHFGLKWGRRMPVVSTRLLAACGYLVCLILSLTCPADPASRWLPWAMIAGLSISTFCCDLGVPALWAYAQDVGGNYTASIMGWTNMFGNFGAAFAPLIYNAALGESPTNYHWNSLFAVCAATFVLSGCAAFVIDATKPITSQPQT
jgi:sugar phosphate permease